jgi:hypothetical protein
MEEQTYTLSFNPFSIIFIRYKQGACGVILG